MARKPCSARKPYYTDVTDAQWEIIQPLIPPERWGGRTRSVDMREVYNAICYILRTGCQWRALPHEFPAYNTVYGYFARFRDDGTLERINAVLRERVREEAGRERQPSLVIADSQSARTTEKGGPGDMTPARRSRAASVM